MKNLFLFLLCFSLFSCQKETVEFQDDVIDANTTLFYGEEPAGEYIVTSLSAGTVYGNVSVQLLLNTNGGPGNSADGVKAFFHNGPSPYVSEGWSYGLGNEDSYKWTNPDENIGIIPDIGNTGNTLPDYPNSNILSIDGQPYPKAGKTDTIFLKFWPGEPNPLTDHGFLQDSYVLQISKANMPSNIEVYFCDKYMGSKKLITDEVYNKPFTVTTKAKAGPFRFKLLIHN